MQSTKLILIIIAASILATGCAGVMSSPNVQSTQTELEAKLEDADLLEAKMFAAKNPNNPGAHLRLAAQYLRIVRETGNYSLNRKAEEQIIKAEEIEPNSFEAKVFRAQILLSEHEFLKALEKSAEMEKDRPRNQVALAIKTDALTELGRFDEAVKAAQEFVDVRPNAASYSRVAQLRFLHGDVEGALQARKTAIRMADPQQKETYAWYLCQYGNDLFESGNFDDAGKAFAKALEFLKDYHWALAGQGKVAAALGDLQTAESVYQKLDKQSPTTDRKIFLADIKLSMGKNEEAKTIYSDAAKSTESENGDMHRIALLWGDHNQNLEKALRIAKADKKENNDLAASDTYAWLLYKNGNFKDAKSEMADAMRIDSKKALFSYHSGMIEKALGNNEEAKRLLKTALATNPSFDLIQVGILKRTLAAL